MDISTFRHKLEEKGIVLSDHQVAQFEQYYETLIEWNQKMNLTGITDKKEVYLKHFYDSITASMYIPLDQPLRVCDVGAGAGFPSIPLKICYPSLQVTIVDSLNKRIHFLNHLASTLQLDDVAFYHNRAELFGQDDAFRGQFDIVMARAVAHLSVLSELCLPLVRTNGYFIAMKGANVNEEVNQAQSALEILGGNIKTVEHLNLPENGGERNIVIMKKKKKSPKKYPRKPGKPNKQPL
ncbi:16S rRNA methyltransferase GidB [Gracilibacillus halophilus YIM-C55.5]|uniref:Ribosomal RNA small subunit methyltransferase G n=1 Tax=Gracilibacillus halophilus YIM-C55.5 TaxID=1308866 RepID=N4WGR4_9BACI|nr:16S rRNA (guanine(527)-N(7))-methyltransferase RsmG [Gracilibacillus halophilus]ENH98444.1 16S rRNA methyltransferase GidB [Gracilibacillus halophilus YIM-C55.5]